ncbi:Protein Y44A6C.1, partial [Aphelenchoides avenae]
NVRLEVFKIRRRYVGQSFPVVSELINKNAETLRVLGKIGLSEAVASFSDVLHLERLSLMNFDLVEDGELDSAQLAEKTTACVRRLSGLGARFEHLSYTAYTGFDISKNPTLYMLKTCDVKSLRLTMQQGQVISDAPASRSLLDALTRLELVGGVEMPQRCNLSQLFPRLQHFDLQRQDLATGQRAAAPPVPRDVLNVIEEMAAEQPVDNAVQMEQPMAAAC